ncbi:MAG TPA: isoprenylcysteine carboxylmethyltransferase family protein [Anaerolineales bacterium]
MWQLVVFVVVSCGLVYISRRSLTRPRSHGFYRFLAWEFLLALLLLNASSWFDNAAAWYQLVSWLLLLVSIIPLVLGVAALRRMGRPDALDRTEPELLGFERTTRLVTDGIYKHIRHPLYSSLLLLGWGIFFKSPSYLDAALVLIATLLLVATARTDEAECMRVFGVEYGLYMKRSRMFIPYLF